MTAAGATLRLRDGRSLGYLEVGKAEGPALFYCHGEPSSRLEALLIAVPADALGLRLIALDRPGIGRSDAKPGFRIVDWPADVGEAADQLGIARFAVLGFSGGGPFALACAAQIPRRLTACGLVSATPPVAFLGATGPRATRTAYWLLERLPAGLLRLVLGLSMRRMAASPAAAVESSLVGNARRLGPADQRVLQSPEVRRLFAPAVVESFRQGADANVREAMRLVRPWGFGVEEMTFERTSLWHGERDRLMPVAPARRLARVLPHAMATFYPDAGHLSTLIDHAPDILKARCAEP